MSQDLRLLWFLIIFVGPWGATIYLTNLGLQESNLETLGLVGVIVLASLLFSVAGSLALRRIIDPANVRRLANIGRANLILSLADVVIFALLVYGRRHSAAVCALGSKCLSFPAIWLALAGMHFCYAVTSYSIKFNKRVDGA
jgi:hypothetical protein